jgi:hypothetical protein
MEIRTIGCVWRIADFLAKSILRHRQEPQPSGIGRGFWQAFGNPAVMIALAAPGSQFVPILVEYWPAAQRLK